MNDVLLWLSGSAVLLIAAIGVGVGASLAVHRVPRPAGITVAVLTICAVVVASVPFWAPLL